MIETTSANRNRLAEVIKQLVTSWKSGEGLRVEHFQEDLRAISANIDDWYDLVIREIQCRRAAKQAIIEEEYYQRFPWLSDRLAEYLETKNTAQLHRSQSILPTLKHGANPEIEGYRILCELGRGGMGVVYKAIQTKLNRTVALKVMLSGSFASAEDRERFRLEVESTAQLQHENIVQVYEVGEANGFPYCSLEYVEGGTLAQLLNQGVMPPRRAAEIAIGIALGAQHAHEHGIIHRDLKPSNVLLTSFTAEGKPKITDFGIAKRFLENSRLTSTGIAAGTPQYMSPEQALARKDIPLGPGVDVYAIGVILYEMLTGKVPFDSDNPVEIMQKVVSETPTLPNRYQTKIPRDLETICLKCLEKNPEERYLSASGLVRDLDRYLRGLPVQARRISPVEQAYRWCRRNPVVASLLTSVFLILIVGTLVASILAVRSANYAEQAQKNATLLEEKTSQAEKAANEARQRAKEADEARNLEREQREAAESARLASEKATQEANEAKNEAQLKTKEANRLSTQLQSEIYAVKMALAHSEYQSGQIDNTVDILNKLESSADLKSLRGFEWYYLKSLVRSYLLHQVFNRPLIGVNSVKGAWIVTDRFAVYELSLNTMKRTNLYYNSRGRIVCFGISSDARYLAVAETGLIEPTIDSIDQATIQIIDRTDPKLNKKISLKNLAVKQYPTSLVFSPNGKTIYVSIGSMVNPESAGKVLAIDPEKGEIDHEFNSPSVEGANALTSGVNAIALAVEGKYLIAGEHSGRVVIFQTQTKQVHYSMSLAGTFSGVVSVAGANKKPLAAVGTTTGNVVLIDIDKKEVRNTIPVVNDHVHAIALTEDGQYCASGGNSGIIKIHNCQTGMMKWRRPAHNVRISGLCFDNDARTLCSIGDDQVLATWDITKDEFGGVLLDINNCWNQVFPYGKDETFFLDSLGTIQQHRMDSTILPIKRSFVKPMPRFMSPVAMSLSLDPKSQTAAYVWNDKHRLLSWHHFNDRNLLSYTLKPTKGLPTAVAIQPGGKTLAVATEADTIEFIHDFQIPEKRNHIVKPGTGKRVQQLLYSPDGKTLALATHNEVVILDEKGERLSHLKTQMIIVENLCYSPDGSMIGVCGAIRGRGVVQLWNVKNGNQISSFEGHNREVTCMAFSPDGKRLVTGGFDSTVRLWDVASQRLLLTLTGHSRMICSVCFLGEGQTIISTSENEARIWDAHIGYRIANNQSPRSSPEIGQYLAKLDIGELEGFIKPNGELLLFWELLNKTDQPIKVDSNLGFLQGLVEVDLGPTLGFPEGRRVVVAFPKVPIPAEIPSGAVLKFQINAALGDLKLDPLKGYLNLRWSDGTINPSKAKPFKLTRLPVED